MVMLQVIVLSILEVAVAALVLLELLVQLLEELLEALVFKLQLLDHQLHHQQEHLDHLVMDGFQVVVVLVEIIVGQLQQEHQPVVLVVEELEGLHHQIMEVMAQLALEVVVAVAHIQTALVATVVMVLLLLDTQPNHK